MKIDRLSKFIKTYVSAFLIMATATASSSEFQYNGPELRLDYSGPIIIDNSHVKYTASDRLTFITQNYLNQNIPRLLPLREAIDTWAAMQSVHPRLLSEIVNNHFHNKPVNDSFDHKQTVFQLATGFNQSFQKMKNDDLAASKVMVAIANAYKFDLNLDKDFSKTRILKEHDYFKGSAGPPLLSYFTPPWPIGESWAGGGSHTNTGSGDGPRNSLDFFKTFVAWGADTSDVMISSSQAGIVRVFSSCNINVIHPNGWVSTYYHLDNIQVEDFANVAINQPLSNYADNLSQATCQGGHSTRPHLHFSIYYDGDPISVDQTNVDFSSWKHHEGIENYDSDCSRSYYLMLPGDNTVCPFFRQLPNNTTGDFLFLNGFEQ